MYRELSVLCLVDESALPSAQLYPPDDATSQAAKHGFHKENP